MFNVSAAGRAALLLMLLGTASASAQISPFRGTRQGMDLDKADNDLLRQATAQLNEARTLNVGDKQDWSNPDSGNAGSVKVTRLYRAAGLACHTLHYDLTFKARPDRRSYDVNWCKTATGWKIKS